jgi:VCBS repeat-containing protein
LEGATDSQGTPFGMGQGKVPQPEELIEEEPEPPPAEPIILAPDAIAIDEDTIAMGNVLENDPDVVREVISFTVGEDDTVYNAGDTVNIPDVGEFVLNPDGSYTFVPVENWYGEVPQVSYTTDTDSTTTLDIIVNPIDDALLATAGAGAVSEDSILSTGGELYASDIDILDNPVGFVPQTDDSSPYGVFTIDADGVWTYTLDNQSDAVQSMNNGQTVIETYSVDAINAQGITAPTEVIVTIAGADDVIIVSSGEGVVSEDGVLAAGGQLTGSDIDTLDGEVSFEPTSGSSAYGGFSIGVDGNWTYTLDNQSEAVQTLDQGQTIIETYAVTAVNEGGESAPTEVVITIHGAPDQIFVSSGEGAVSEDGVLAAEGQLAKTVSWWLLTYCCRAISTRWTIRWALLLPVMTAAHMACSVSMPRVSGRTRWTIQPHNT